MREVAAPASIGYSIMLDQCPRCGGIWCDRWELYPLSAASADRLDPVDLTALARPAARTSDPLGCPRCRARMRRFQDPLLPREARIERCPNCDGMWLNRGELRRFKHRDAIDKAARVPTDADLDRLAQQATSSAAAATPTPIRHLADALEATETAPDSDAVRTEVLGGAAWFVARTVLRLLLHI